MIKNLTFKKFHSDRKIFLQANKNNDHGVVEGKNNILISAPHGVSQIRLGKLKVAEIGSLATSLFLAKNTNSFLIAKTKNNNDDANFDEKSLYKTKLIELIKKHNIKYVIDIHGLAAHRDCDINLGTHIGKNIEKDSVAFDILNDSLIKNEFIVSIDQPFMGGKNTISATAKAAFNKLWTIQIEINCSLSNKQEYFDKLKSLLIVLTNWIKSLENRNI